MPVFEFEFTVDAPLLMVSEFHASPNALKTLTPPLMLMQVHRSEPIANGAIAEFTLWMGPIPVRWKAIHSSVSKTGFTDTQTAGPMQKWVHTHTFESTSEDETTVREHIEYEHFGGLRGFWSRMLFPRHALLALFTIRKMITRREVAKRKSNEQQKSTVQKQHPDGPN